MDNQKCLWYFIGYCGGNVTHVEHDYMNSEDARKQGQKMFDKGKTIEGLHLEFNRVMALSENYEIAIDITKNKETILQ